MAMSTLESQPKWVKSSLSFANGNCVEVADLSGGEIGVRNSRDAEGWFSASRPTSGMRSSAAYATASSTASAADRPK